ncbi:kinase-like domain-containing protein [Kockovaella imperatae]|uniref:non-specific serine/threonine protein kinase n=1 Tax=Kockovaella imperatae TaxID=4999 RepID=A0A1Y1UA60_9TREE|nr:kinase-like domain-containing protein [Kockovaella imperatae]ORX34920.1 kinase-like domain-containing protein [Kockovaella imperatae]
MSSSIPSGSSLVDPSVAYTLLEKLGTGSFGTVWKAKHNDTGKIVAIKMIDLESSDDDISEIQAEIAHLSACDSEFVTRYYGSFVRGWRLWIVMEYLAGGSCSDLLKPGVFTEGQIAIICRELLMGLLYLHEEGKIHRDIKAANILLSANGAVKLADFGVAAQLSSHKSQRHTFVGTPFWMAPEVIRQAGYDSRADIWSLGITAMEMAKGDPPLVEYHPMRVLFLIPKAKAPRLDENEGWSAEFQDFISCCLQKDPKDRATAKDLLQHKFIRSARSTSRLVELVTRYNAFRVQSPAKKSTPSKTLSKQAGGGDYGTITPGTIKSEWNFDETIRMTVRGAPVELDLTSMSDDDDEWDLAEGSGTARVKGTVRANSRATSEVSLPGLDASSQTHSVDSLPITPGSSDSEDASSTKSGTPGKSTWRQRNDRERGTVMRMDDVGDGYSTVRPVKKVDEIASSRASQEFIGTGSVRRIPDAGPSAKVTTAKSPAKPRKTLNAKGRAGQVLVEEVVLGVLDQVRGLGTRDINKAYQVSTVNHDASAVEAVNTVRKGFADLGTADPELAYRVIMDILGGIQSSETVHAQIRDMTMAAMVDRSRPGVAPHIRREGGADKPSGVELNDLRGKRPSDDLIKDRSPLADMLYLRWLDGIKLKWPGS